jgi:hypothetical protein
MQIYANSHAIEQACKTLPDQSLKMLFQQRYDQLRSDDYEVHEIVHFWVVESVDDLDLLPKHIECKEQDQGWLELVFFVPEHLTGFLK